MKLLRSIKEFISENLDIIFKLNGKEPKDISGFKKVALIANWFDMGYKNLINSYLDQTDAGQASPTNLSNYTKKFTYGNIIFYVINNENYKELPTLRMPIINWASQAWMDKIKKEGYEPNPKFLYNSVEEKEKCFSKSEFYKIFDGEDFITPTVYTVEDAKDLNYPIIAKPDRGHTGVGITKFDSFKELKSYEYLDSFDLFQEAIKIHREIRIGVLKDEVIFYFIRKPMDNKSKFLAGKEKSEEGNQKKMADKELDFKYIIMSSEQFYGDDMLARDVLDIVKKVKKKIDLEFIVFDIAIDKNDKKYILELNVHPGVPGATLWEIYKAVYEDFYGEKFPKEGMEYVKTINRLLINSTINVGKYIYSNAYLKKYTM